MSGGRISVLPPIRSNFEAEKNTIAGNTLLYGATSGEVYINGRVGERFAVRNSGAVAVVEGVGDHCCEYMTGGRVVVLGQTGRNFAAGMSGGVAYVWNKDGNFDYFCNMEMVELSLIEEASYRKELHELIRQHYHLHRLETGTHYARQLESLRRSIHPSSAHRIQKSTTGRTNEKVTTKNCRYAKRLLDNFSITNYFSIFNSQFLIYMGDPRAFLNIARQEAGYRPVSERITDYSQVEQTLNTNSRKLQASRCMDCGVPFCHWACPIGNKQPEWQDALYRGKWKEAYEVLSSTCDFPEFTGRICPALCEKSCVLKLSCDQPVTIRENEAAIVEAAFREGYIQVKTPERNGKKVAVIGAGPAGLVVANQLNLKGYSVTLFDKDEAPGGLLRFGILISNWTRM